MHSVSKTGRLWKLKCYKSGKGICHFFFNFSNLDNLKNSFEGQPQYSIFIFSRSINCKLWECFKLYWLTSWWSQKNTVNGKYTKGLKIFLVHLSTKWFEHWLACDQGLCLLWDFWICQFVVKSWKIAIVVRF